ncbi:hypothetical protein S83_047416, partial [Arachis hypogaea]
LSFINVESLCTDTFGRLLVWSPQLASTHDVVLHNFCELPIGSVCLADVQTKGRGLIQRLSFCDSLSLKECLGVSVRLSPVFLYSANGGWVNSSVGAVCGFPCYHRSSEGYLQQKCIPLKYILVIKVFMCILYTWGDKIYDNPDTTKKVHHKILSSLLGSYKYGFSGFAARLTKSQAEEAAKFPGVVSVIPNQIHKLHTTRSWDFLGIHHSSSNTVSNEINLGEGTIIGVIDT